jgi:hypothetical protein
MKRAVVAALVVFVVAGATAVYAQQWPDRSYGRQRQSIDDRLAFADARIAAVKAGLRLTPEQESLWPPVEDAARELARQRTERIDEPREARPDGWGPRSPDEMFDRFRRRAERMAASATSMQRLAEAAEPLYRTLSEDQKHRLVALAGPHAGPHWREHWSERLPRWRERTGLDEPPAPGYRPGPEYRPGREYGPGRERYREPSQPSSGRI